MVDVVEFWKDLPASAHIHPADSEVLSSVEHGLQLDCLPVPFYGPLKQAPIILLYLNPGLSDKDLREAGDPEKEMRRFRQRQGYESLADQVPGQPKSWWVSRTRFLGSPEQLRSKLAVLEICPYHSKEFRDTPLLSALPSCRAMLGWAQDVVFPRARAGEIVVICLRAARRWGLEPGQSYGRSLFAPKTSRGGHILEGEMREKIMRSVRAIVDVKAA